MRPPDELQTFDERGEFEVRVKARGGITRFIYDHHPLDVVGWDGHLWPYAFNIEDFEPITGRVHQPPPVHQTFDGPGFVLCSFVPRLFDYHPLSIPAPYNHSNVDSDEVLYYVEGNFMSRKGIEQASFTIHPNGIPHGPHPGTYEGSIGKERTEELAVMVDTFRPLRLTQYAREIEDEGYAYSWLPSRNKTKINSRGTKQMIMDPDHLNRKERYKLMIGSILPRPIAWVSTMDVAGNLNLAPFSYFTAVCPDPMTLLFCPGWSPCTRRHKDTWPNMEQVPEFVVNITNEVTKEAMNLSATEFEHGRNEFEWAGVTPAPSTTVRVPRVAEAPIAFECKLQQIVVVNDGPGGGAVVFGEVQAIHVHDDVYDNGYIVLEALQPIGRLAGFDYAHINDVFEMRRVAPPVEK